MRRLSHQAGDHLEAQAGARIDVEAVGKANALVGNFNVGYEVSGIAPTVAEAVAASRPRQRKDGQFYTDSHFISGTSGTPTMTQWSYR